MKAKVFLLTVCLLSSLTMLAQDKNINNFFDKYENEDNVTVVSISKAMFNMISGSNINTGSADISAILPKMESMRIITSENKDLKEKMAAESKAIITKNNKYEELMRIKDGKSNVTFNAIKKGDIINELLMLIINENNFAAIQILGNFTVEDIQKITKNKDNP
jgi:hypothetical protein